jgi:hypothetical protein
MPRSAAFDIREANFQSPAAGWDHPTDSFAPARLALWVPLVRISFKAKPLIHRDPLERFRRDGGGPREWKIKVDDAVESHADHCRQ